MVLEAKTQLLITKQNHKVSHLYFYSCQKNGILDGFIYFHTFTHDVTCALLVFQNNEMAAMLCHQTSHVGVELYSYIKTFFCVNKLA